MRVGDLEAKSNGNPSLGLLLAGQTEMAMTYSGMGGMEGLRKTETKMLMFTYN